MSLAFAKSLRALLLADANVNVAVPGGIHPDYIPQEATFPAAAYTVNSTPASSISGTFGICTAEMVLHLRAITPAQIAAAGAAVLQSVINLPNRTEAHGTIIAGLRVTGATYDAETLADGDDVPYQTAEITISGWVREL